MPAAPLLSPGRPTPAASELLERLIHRVETENGWDQAIFNEVIFFPSRPGYKARACRLRAVAVAVPRSGVPARRPAGHAARLADRPARPAPPRRLQDPAVTRRILDIQKFMNVSSLGRLGA